MSNQVKTNPDGRDTGPSHNYVIYEQLLTGCLDKIRKTLPKKAKELRDLCGEAMDQVKADETETALSANKYFRIMKLALDAKIPRMTEQILYYIQKLVAHGLLDGNHPDDCLYPDEERPESNGMLPRKLIDAIVDEICKCTTERDQQVQLQVVRALLTIVATSTTEVHERSLLKVVSSLYYIHIACANQVNQNTAKASLIQLISIVFKKLEQHSGEFGESLRRLGTGDVSTAGESARGGNSGANSVSGQVDAASSSGRMPSKQGHTNQRNFDTTGQDQLRTGAQSSSRTGQSQEESKREETPPMGTNSDALVTFSPTEQYAQVTLTLIVDSVCLHSARLEEVKKTFAARGKALIEAEGEKSDGLIDIQRQMKQTEESIPLFAVPLQAKSSRTKAKGEGDDNSKSGEVSQRQAENDEILVNLKNEVGAPSGKFGWCVACRGTANLYCKHTRHPVCSFECKQRHIRLLEEANASTEPSSGATPRAGNSGSAAASFDEPYQRDARLVFNKLCQLLQSKDLDRKLENVYDVRKVLLGLDLIHSCLENPGSTFINRGEFVADIRDSLCGALLKFAVSSEHKIFSRTVSIFYCLFLHFREHLKQTIGVFIDNFFLRILDSGNSEYDYKYSILEFFDRLSDNSDHILEIFANYDCDIGQKDICVRMIESLSQIAQGSFQRGEHAGAMTVQQETSLRRQALEVLVKVLRNLNRTIDASTKLESLTQTRLAKTRHERATMLQSESAFDGKYDEDGSSSRGDQSLITEQEGEADASAQERPTQSARALNNEQQASQDSPDARQQMKNRLFKADMAKAAAKFTRKDKDGIKYLIEKGYVPKEPGEAQVKAVTKFLKTTPSVGPTAIGVFFGGTNQLNKDVLSNFIDEIDFTSKDLSFVAAMKLMLSGFRVPREAQQADRVMEKFGEKLARDRPDEFGNAEGVYLLSYATLMLQTSLHNPQAQKLRMTMADFSKITSGVKLSEAGQPDWAAFLADVYEQVAREPFTLEEDEDARLRLESASGTSKKLLFDREREGILRRGAASLKQDHKNNRFVLIKDISTIRPMFENTWRANLAVFGALLGVSEDPIIADLCLQGFVHAIRISGYFDMPEARGPLVTSLAKLTEVSAKEVIKPKNISCIRALLALALHDGDCLRDCWRQVLQCVSRIDHLRALGLGDLTDSQLFQSAVAPSGGAQPPSQQVLMKNSAIIAEQIDAQQIESIFLQSVNLNTDAIIDFIGALCQVSQEELADEDNPKKFCLQKLVEVASLNMNRVRFQWQSIWSTLGEHFTRVGSHKNLHVVIYALDSLRQLADKFLEKEERRNFSYQKMFLKPFETILLNNLASNHAEIKEYVVMCMAALCHKKAKYIKSGWEVILGIFTLAAQEAESHLVVQSFQSLEFAVTNHFPILEESFLELVHCLSKFSQNGGPKLQEKALRLVVQCASELIQRETMLNSFMQGHGRELQAVEDDDTMQSQVYGIKSQFLLSVTSNVPGSSKEDLAKGQSKSRLASESQNVRLSALKALWFPILKVFTSLITGKQINMRSAALSCLEETLAEHHKEFGPLLWRGIMDQVMLPALETLRQEVEHAQTKEAAEASAITLRSFLQVFNRVIALPATQPLLTELTDVLFLFASNVCNQDLADMVMGQIRQLLAGPGAQNSSYEQWADVIEQISYLFQISRPSLLQEEMQTFQTQQMPELMTLSQKSRIRGSGEERVRKFEQSYAQCTTWLQLTRLVAEIVQSHFDSLQPAQLATLLEALESQYQFAKEFNSEDTLRLRLWKSGYMATQDLLPGLLAQEEESLKVSLSIEFKQFFSQGHGKARGQAMERNQRLFARCSKVLEDYVLKHGELVSIKPPTQISGPKVAGSVAVKQSNLQSLSEDQITGSMVRETELERQISHLSPVIHQVILENLLRLSDDDLSKQLGVLGPLLVDLTLCNDYQVRSKNRNLLSRVLEHYQSIQV